jgi:hypothetical protein
MIRLAKWSFPNPTGLRGRISVALTERHRISLFKLGRCYRDFSVNPVHRSTNS